MPAASPAIREWILRTFIIGLSISLLAAVCELFLHLSHQTQGNVGQSSRTGIMQTDFIAQWKPRRDWRDTRLAPNGQVYQLSINSTGQRGPELPEAGVERVLFLGDSFTMAVQVPTNQTFVHQVGQMLSERYGQAVAGINGGVNGYGTYQQLAYYQYYSRPLKPDLVVLCFFAGNDYRDNMVSTSRGRLLNPVLLPSSQRYLGGDDPRLRSEEGQVLQDPLSNHLLPKPTRPWLEWLQRHSLLARLLAARYARIQGWLNADLFLLDLHHQYYYYQIGFYQDRKEDDFRVARELTLACLDALHRRVIDDGAELLVVLLPTANQVDPAHWQQTLAKIEIDAEDLEPLDFDAPHRLIRKHCTTAGITYLDLINVFSAAPDPGALYIDGDGHLSAAGHQLAAQHIAPFLAESSTLLTSPAALARRQGLEQVREAQWGQAHNLLMRASELRPDWVGPQLDLGDLYCDQGRWSEAIAAYRQALSLAPASLPAYDGLINASLARADTSEAIASCKEGLRLHPEWWPFLHYLQDIHLSQGEQERAMDFKAQIENLFNAKVNADRSHFQFQLYAGRGHLENGRLYRAEYAFRLALATGVEPAQAHYNLGIVYKKQSRLYEALQQQQATLEINPNDNAAQDQVRDLIGKLRATAASPEDWARFADGLEAQRRLEPENAELGLLLSDARFRQGSLLLSANQYPKAIATLEQVLYVDSTYANAYINLASAYINLGQTASAIRSYERFLTLDGTPAPLITKVLRQLDLLKRTNASNH